MNIRQLVAFLSEHDPDTLVIWAPGTPNNFQLRAAHDIAVRATGFALPEQARQACVVIGCGGSIVKRLSDAIESDGDRQ